MPNLPRGIMERLTKSYVTPTLQLHDTWGGPAGIKMRINVIVHSKTLFYAENCARLSDLFANGNQGDSCNPKNCHRIKHALWRKLSRPPWWENTRTRTPPRYTLEVYDKMSILIPVDIAEDVVELVTWKLLGSSIPGVTYSEYLLGWLLKFKEDSKRICTSVKTFA